MFTSKLISLQLFWFDPFFRHLHMWNGWSINDLIKFSFFLYLIRKQAVLKNYSIQILYTSNNHVKIILKPLWNWKNYLTKITYIFLRFAKVFKFQQRGHRGLFLFLSIRGIGQIVLVYKLHYLGYFSPDLIYRSFTISIETRSSL